MPPRGRPFRPERARPNSPLHRTVWPTFSLHRRGGEQSLAALDHHAGAAALHGRSDSDRSAYVGWIAARRCGSLTRSLGQRGFRWAYRVVDTRSLGPPQRRRRVFMLASRDDDPRDVLFADDSGPLPEVSSDGIAYGFSRTEGTRGLGWGIDAVPTLKGGSTVGIPSPPGIGMPDGSIVFPEVRDAERLQGFLTGRSRHGPWHGPKGLEVEARRQRGERAGRRVGRSAPRDARRLRRVR